MCANVNTVSRSRLIFIRGKLNMAPNLTNQLFCLLKGLDWLFFYVCLYMFKTPEVLFIGCIYLHFNHSYFKDVTLADFHRYFNLFLLL